MLDWNDCLYCYHQERGGLFLGAEDDGILIFVEKDQPLLVGQFYETEGRGGWYRVRARTAVKLERDYTLKIGAKKELSGGVNRVLGALDVGLEKVSGAPDLLADYGCPEVTGKRLIRTSDRRFTRLVLQSLDLRNALLASPWDAVKVLPGPGGAGLHQVEVVAGSAEWTPLDETPLCSPSWEQVCDRAHKQFFPRLDQLLDLARAARDAVAAWRM